MKDIRSKDNKLLKFAKKVGARREKEFLFVEGARLVREVLANDLQDSEIFVSDGFISSNPEIIRDIRKSGIPVSAVSDAIFGSLAKTKTPQGIVLIARKPAAGKKVIEARIRPNKDKMPVVLLLNQIQNPGNIGAIFRTSEAAGVSGIIVTKDSTDPFSPTAIRGSMGAAVRVPVWNDADYSAALEWGIKNGLTPTGVDIKGETSYLDAEWNKPRLLVFGSEPHGLSSEDLSGIRERITIPMKNNVESLNVAASCAIILFEIVRKTTPQ